jgi:hypothetical protein
MKQRRSLMPVDTDKSDRRPTRRSVLWRQARAGASDVADRAATAGRAAARWFGRTSLGQRLRREITDWPEELDAQLDVSGSEAVASDAVPTDGDLVCYVHGFLGEGRLESVPASGAHQAEALRVALEAEFADRSAEPPQVVAVMWGSSTEWNRAKRRTRRAGRTFAAWLDANRDAYDSVTIIGHSLGGRLTLWTLDALEDTTVDTVALLGAALPTDAVCTQFRDAVESRVTGTVYNYYSERDYAVCYVYRLLEGHPGLGCRGSDCVGGPGDAGRCPENFVDVDVTDAVAGHRDYYKPPDGEFGQGNCVDLLVDQQLSR